MIIAVSNNLAIAKNQYNIQNMNKWILASQLSNINVIFEIKFNDANIKDNGVAIPEY